MFANLNVIFFWKFFTTFLKNQQHLANTKNSGTVRESYFNKFSFIALYNQVCFGEIYTQTLLKETKIK